MELVSIVGILRRRRLVVALGLVLSVLAAAAMVQKERTTVAARASGGVLLTTPDATATDLSSKIASTIPDRATLLADLMATERARAEIARIAGIAPSDLAVRIPAMGAPQLATPLPVSAEKAGLPLAPYTVLVSTPDPTAGSGVPLIKVEAAGPNAAGAARVVSAVVSTMAGLVQAGSKSPGVVVQPLGTPMAQLVKISPSKILPAMAVFLVFGFWCAAIVVATGLTRRRRAGRAPRTGPAATVPSNAAAVTRA